MTEECQTRQCPVAIDCKWSNWKKYGTCSKSCGGGTQTWQRTELIKARNGGQPCQGETTKREPCNTNACDDQKQCCKTLVGKIECITTYLSNGKCEVKMFNGPPGKTLGECSPLDNGRCNGIPEPCFIGNHISSQCAPISERSDCLSTPCEVVQCVTTCKPNGGCNVEMRNGPPGKLQGFCWPPSFGGECSDIPKQCSIGDKIETQCGSPCKEGTRYV